MDRFSVLRRIILPPGQRRATEQHRLDAAPPTRGQPTTENPTGTLGLAVPSAVADWPVLRLFEQTENRPAPDEPSALRVLRAQLRSAPGRVPPLARALPSLGPGEPLAAPARWALATILGRPVPQVRLHQSPIAEALGAEAFTTGRQLVFAPGRLDLRSARGLALLGHELAHVGQPLAFKQLAPTETPDADPAERAARQQEEFIQRALRDGWPAEPRSPRPAASGAPDMALRRSVATTPEPVVPREWSAAPARGTVAPVAVQRSAQGTGPAAKSAEPLAVARVVEQPPAAGAGAAAPDVEQLARQVFTILKTQLRAERDRHQVY